MHTILWSLPRWERSRAVCWSSVLAQRARNLQSYGYIAGGARWTRAVEDQRGCPAMRRSKGFCCRPPVRSSRLSQSAAHKMIFFIHRAVHLLARLVQSAVGGWCRRVRWRPGWLARKSPDRRYGTLNLPSYAYVLSQLRNTLGLLHSSEFQTSFFPPTNYPIF